MQIQQLIFDEYTPKTIKEIMPDYNGIPIDNIYINYMTYDCIRKANSFGEEDKEGRYIFSTLFSIITEDYSLYSMSCINIADSDIPIPLYKYQRISEFVPDIAIISPMIKCSSNSDDEFHYYCYGAYKSNDQISRIFRIYFKDEHVYMLIIAQGYVLDYNFEKIFSMSTLINAAAIEYRIKDNPYHIRRIKYNTGDNEYIKPTIVFNAKKSFYIGIILNNTDHHFCDTIDKDIFMVIPYYAKDRESYNLAKKSKLNLGWFSRDKKLNEYVKSISKDNYILQVIDRYFDFEYLSEKGNTMHMMIGVYYALNGEDNFSFGSIPSLFNEGYDLLCKDALESIK